MTFENVTIPVLTFMVGLLSGLLYKYADIVELKTDVKTIKTNQSGVNSLTGDVKAMRESLIFKPDFIQKLAQVCAEHQDLHDQTGKNTGDLQMIKALLDIKAK